MSTSPAKGPLPAFRLGGTHCGNGDHAALSISPRRRTLRPAIADEGVRHFEDVLLPVWNVSPQRTTSPASRNRKGGLELCAAALFESGAPLSPARRHNHPTAAAHGGVSNLSFSSPLTPSANGALVHLPPTAFDDPHSWAGECAQLRGRFLRPSDAVTVYHDHTAPLNSRATMRHVCVVHPLPNLGKVQEALRRRCAAQKSASAYDAFEQQCNVTGLRSGLVEETASVAPLDDEVALRGAHSDQRNDIFVPTARTWCVSGSTYDNEIVVYASTTGQRLMRVVSPKMKVAVTAMQHAPFRGFIEAQQLRVLPVRDPQDVLRLNPAQLVYTDYVWCGLQDGTLRLIPAGHQHIRAGGPSPPYSKSPSVDLVYELPRYQGGAIVSIVRSPGHHTNEREEEETVDAGSGSGDGVDAPFRDFPNRVSEAVRCMTAAAATTDCDDSRRHLSLVCTASTDATVVIWDVRKVYEAVAQLQQHRREAAKSVQSGQAALRPRHGSLGGTHGNYVSSTTTTTTATNASSTLCNDVVTFDCSSPFPGLQNMVVRSSCTVLQVRPVAKLSGGFAGLTAMRWVSSLISAGMHVDPALKRDVRKETRIPQIAPRPTPHSSSASRVLSQTQTRFDKREAQRAELELAEDEMQGMERELEHMLPPLATEPPQSLRVNLLVAADCMGTVHVWNLDEELHRYGDGVAATGLDWPTQFGASSRASARSTSSRSEGRSSVSYALELSPNATPTRQSMKRNAGGSSVRGSRGSHKRTTERSTKSRRPLGGLGLAEAREKRSQLSELSPGRSSQQRPSLGRSSCEERDGAFATTAAAGLSWTEHRDGPRLSIGDTAPCLTPPRKSRLATSPSRAPAHNVASTAHGTGHEAPLLRSRKDANAMPSSTNSAVTPTKKAKKARGSLQESSPSLLRSPQTGASPSRASVQRPSASSGRHGETHQHVAPSSSARLRGSVQRGSSVSLGNSSVSPGQDLALPAQASKCQICLADGAAITDMVVDLPRRICTTLRRIRNPLPVTASWQHRPTEAEMDARVLENEFEELTEEKALFFAFQRLELYVGVDGGAVTTVRCAPEWVLPDSDGRELFKTSVNAAHLLQSHGAAAGGAGAATPLSELAAEVMMPDPVRMDAFDLHLSRRLLDVHVQPITQLFLDSWQGRVWVARQDGFVSILSTQDKQLVSRMAHPSADALLPPPTAQEWAKLQAQFATRYAEEPRGRVAAATDSGVMGFGLECHKECKGLPPNHVTAVLPIGTRRQRALILFAAADADAAAEGAAGAFCRRLSLTDDSHQDVTSPLKIGPPMPSASASGQSAEAARCASTTSARLAAVNALVNDYVADSTSMAVGVDGQADVKSDSRTRVAHQWRWLQELQVCRVDALAACQAQRQRYHALCDGVSRSVGHVIKELGDYAALSQLRTYFHAWRDHRFLFRHTYAMRRQRTARLQREQPLAHQLSTVCATKLRGAYFVKWMGLVSKRRRASQDEALCCFARSAAPAIGDGGVGFSTRLRRRRHNRPLPTAAMMERLHFFSSAQTYFKTWQSWAAEAVVAAVPSSSTTSIVRRHRHQPAPSEQEGCHPYTPVLSLRRTTSSPTTTPPRRMRRGQVGLDSAPAEEECTAQDMITPYRPIHSGGEAFAYTSSWSVGERRHAEEALPLPLPLTPSHGRLNSAASLGLSVSVEPFMAEMAELLRARVYVFHFSDARSSMTSVLDESWTVILENAEAGAEGDSDDARRFSVFRFALLPLLQGLLSTADDVLPNLFDESVAEEVLSMLVGIVLAMDYVTASAECISWATAVTAADDMNTASTTCPLSSDVLAASCGESGQLMSTFEASLAVLRIYAARAYRTDSEAAGVLRGLAKSKRVLAQFLDFAMERAVARRMEHF